MHAIGHLDADCFYVSAERVRDDCLIGIPVGVLGNQGACVIAKSYEMKATGVATGEPIWEAVRKCPQGAYLKRDFRWYEVLSRLMLDVVREHSPKVEFYSIDGATRSSETAEAEDDGTAARPCNRSLRAGETPASSCKGDSIGPRVATDHQSLKRAETVVTPNPARNPTQHG